MAGFIRRYLFDPGFEEIAAIEGVVIIDREPPASITGVGSGTVAIVGEFEKGPFNEPCEVASSTDFLNTFGGFGFTYDGVPSQNPCARSRKADAAIIPEYWNGNGFIALAGKKFRRLIIVRVDTSVGEVEFRRLACLKGASDFTFNLEPGDTISTDVGGGPVAATFNATAATVTGVAFVGGLAAGESVTIGYDEEPNVDVVFLASDVTIGDAIARINLAAGFAFASNNAGAIQLTGRKRGTDGEVRIVAEAPAGVLAKLGLVVGTTSGTGNVADIDAVTSLEVHTVIHTANPSVSVARDEGQRLIMCNTTTPETGTLTVTASTAVSLGFNAGDASTAANGEDGVIPAGTRVRNSIGDEWVTMQDVKVTAAKAGPYAVKIRPANDDGTTGSEIAGSANVLPFPIPNLGGFAVINPLPISAALSEATIDSKYQDAFDTTKDVSNVVKETNVIVSARQSNSVRLMARTNAIESSSEGCFGRIACIRPPLKTPRVKAKSTTAQPGVGAYRDQRVVYCYPGVRVFIPQIASVGLSGGAGFTADGRIDVGGDTWLASIMSQLPPEENPGQQTTFATNILGVEADNPDVQGMTVSDYRAFRASGIAAWRMDDGVAIIQSGITSVDPTTHPNLRNIARRRMADFIQDSLAPRMKAFNKKLATRIRRALIIGEIDAFLRGLRSDGNPASQRIENYLIDALSGNTPESLAAGVFRIIIKVRTLPSLDVIVLDTEVGENVQVTEILAA